MNSKLKFILIFFFFFLIALIFRSWFFPFVCLSSGDLSFFFKENIKESSILPFLWRISNLGSMNFFHWSGFYSGTTSIVSSFFNFSWPISVRIFWFWPFVILSIFSSIYLFKSFFSYSLFFCLFSSLIYTTNTYILITTGIGQKGILMAYSIAPLVLGRFIRIMESGNTMEIQWKHNGNNRKDKEESEKGKILRESLIFGLILAVQIMWDLRIAYITLIACGLYVFYQWYLRKFSFSFLISHFSFLISILIVLGLHSYWILPLLITQRSGGTPIQDLGSAYITTEAVEYLSWGKFEQTISLLHSLWPESIYGKTGFMKPEFLVLPILAYGSLLFIKKKTDNKKQITKNRNILFFSLLGLLGAFLSKGSNPPLGRVYLWLFKHFPGMIMFRDATKFYLLTALSYSVLIPFSVFQIYLLIKKLTGSRVNGLTSSEKL